MKLKGKKKSALQWCLVLPSKSNINFFFDQKSVGFCCIFGQNESHEEYCLSNKDMLNGPRPPRK